MKYMTKEIEAEEEKKTRKQNKQFAHDKIYFS